jgi:hypothetical protein
MCPGRGRAKARHEGLDTPADKPAELIHSFGEPAGSL